MDMGRNDLEQGIAIPSKWEFFWFCINSEKGKKSPK